jgi:hypothetical protein
MSVINKVNSYKELLELLKVRLGSLYYEIQPILEEYFEKNVRKKVNLDELDEDIDRLISLIVRPLVHKIVRDNAPDFSWIPLVGQEVSSKVKDELYKKTEDGIKQAKYYLKNDKRLRENLQLFLQQVVDRYQ